MTQAPQKRPLFLVLMMLLATLMAAGGVLQGCATVQVFRAGTVPERPIAPGADVAVEEATRALERAELAIRLDARRTLLPLGIGNLLLSLLMFVAAWRVLGMRPGSRALATQAIAANAVFALIEYAMTREVRGKLAMAFADHLPRAALKGVAMSEAEVWSALDATAWMLFRTRLVVAMLAYAAGYAALTSPSAVDALPSLDEPEDDEA